MIRWKIDIHRYVMVQYCHVFYSGDRMNSATGDESGIYDDIFERVLFTRKEISTRVQQLALEIADAFDAEDITIVPVLTGAIPLVADLMRQLTMPIRVEPVSVSSYPGKSTTSRGCTFRLPPTKMLKDRNVLVVDDIYDSGNTMEFLFEQISSIGPARMKSCVLLYKSRPGRLDRRNRVDFIGFDIPDRFVVGYGMDYNELYRNLPDIGILSTIARGKE